MGITSASNLRDRSYFRIHLSKRANIQEIARGYITCGETGNDNALYSSLSMWYPVFYINGGQIGIKIMTLMLFMERVSEKLKTSNFPLSSNI